MKKYMIFALMIAIVPNYVFGESARYRQLVAEKQRKMAELEQCSGDVNGWKIAGISTLGLTAVGVAGNIALANKQSNLDDKIAKADKQIDKYNSQIEIRQGEIMAENVRRSDCQKTGGTYTSGGCQCPDNMYSDGTICKVKNITPLNTPNQQGDGPKDSQVPNGSNGEGKNCKVGSYTLPHSDSASSNSVSCLSLAGGFDVTNGNVCLCTCQNGAANCVVDSCLNGYAPSADKKKCECNTKSGYEVNDEGKCVKKTNGDKGEQQTQETDCTTEAKNLDSNVVKAVKKGDKCEVTKCESGFEPNDAKTKCDKKSKQKNDGKTQVKTCSWSGNQYAENQSINDISCGGAPANKDRLIGGANCTCKCLADGTWDCNVKSCNTIAGYEFSSGNASHPYPFCKLTGCIYNSNAYSVDEDRDITVPCKTAPANNDKLIGGAVCGCRCVANGKWECGITACDESKYEMVGGKCELKMCSYGGQKYQEKTYLGSFVCSGVPVDLDKVEGGRSCGCTCGANGNWENCHVTSCDESKYEMVDGKCELKTNINNKNLGCFFGNRNISVGKGLKNLSCKNVPKNKNVLTGGEKCSCTCVDDGKWECQITQCEDSSYRPTRNAGSVYKKQKLI